MRWLLSGGRYRHWCPACQALHAMPEGWPYGGAADRPAFNSNDRCHYVISAGHIRFCAGSWHGRLDAVAMPSIPNLHHTSEGKMSKPLVIMVGADKGGVGKTTVSRALDEYLRIAGVGTKLFDGEWPNGDLRQFAPASEVVNLQSLDDQMRMFDRLAGVTLIDIKAGLFTDVLESVARTGLLDDVREGRFNLALLHVLGPSAASLAEVSAISAKLGAGAQHMLVKNYVNEGGYKEWESDARFAGFLAPGNRIISIPHLEARACTEVQRLGQPFGTFIDQSESRVLSGYVRAWLRDAFAAFTAAGLKDLIDQTAV